MDAIFTKFLQALDNPADVAESLANAGEAHDLLLSLDVDGRERLAFPLTLAFPAPVAPLGVECVFLTLSPSSDVCSVSFVLETPADGLGVTVKSPKTLPIESLWGALFRAGLVTTENAHEANPFLYGATNLKASQAFPIYR